MLLMRREWREGIMAFSNETKSRVAKLAAVLRPLGNGPLTLAQAKRAGHLLCLHWTTVYRLWRKFLSDPVVSSLNPRHRGPKVGSHRLDPAVNDVIENV